MFEDLINLDYSIMGSKTVAAFMSEHETNCCGDNNKETVWQILCKMYPEIYKEFKNSSYYKADKNGVEKGAKEYLLSLILDMVYDYFKLCDDKKISVTKYDLIESLSFINKCKNRKGNNKLDELIAEKIIIIVKEFFEKGEIEPFKIIQCCFKKTQKNEYKIKGIDNAIFCVNELFPEIKEFWNNFYGEIGHPIDSLRQAMEPLVGEENFEPQADKKVLIDNIISSLVHAGFVKGKSNSSIGTEYILRDISKLRYALFKETSETSGTILYLRALEDLATFYTIKNGLPLSEKKRILSLLEKTCYGDDLGVTELESIINFIIDDLKFSFSELKKQELQLLLKDTKFLTTIYEIQKKTEDDVLENFREKMIKLFVSHLKQIDVKNIQKELNREFGGTSISKTRSFYDEFSVVFRKIILCKEIKEEVREIVVNIMIQGKNNYIEKAVEEVIYGLKIIIINATKKILKAQQVEKNDSVTRRVTNEIFEFLDSEKELANYIKKNQLFFCLKNRYAILSAVKNDYQEIIDGEFLDGQNYGEYCTDLGLDIEEILTETTTFNSYDLRGVLTASRKSQIGQIEYPLYNFFKQISSITNDKIIVLKLKERVTDIIKKIENMIFIGCNGEKLNALQFLNRLSTDNSCKVSKEIIHILENNFNNKVPTTGESFKRLISKKRGEYQPKGNETKNITINDLRFLAPTCEDKELVILLETVKDCSRIKDVLTCLNKLEKDQVECLDFKNKIIKYYDRTEQTLHAETLYCSNKGFQILRNRLIVYLIDVERIFDAKELNQILTEVGFIELSPNFHEFDRNIVSLLEALENIEEDILEEYKHEQQMQN